MKRRTLILSVLSGLLCAGCVIAYSAMVYRNADAARNEAIQRYGGEQTEVLVATRDIYPGETVDAGNSERKLWVANLLPEDAAIDFSDTAGKTVASPIFKGEVVCSRRFESSTIQIDVPEGLVALSVPAKEIQALGGALEAGSRVDVYAVGSSTSCLGREVQVLATSASGSEGAQATKISWVTLAVEPDRVEEYVSASQQMELYFTLPAAEPQINAQGDSSDDSLSEEASQTDINDKEGAKDE